MSTKFIHSVKVPRIYKAAAKIAKDFSNGVASIKDLVYGGNVKHPNLKAIFSLVSTLFQNSSEIETLLKRSNILEKESLGDPWLIKILIVELLWGKGALVGQSKPENVVRGYEQIFKAHITDKDIKRNSEAPANPRYVRVNTLSLTTTEAIEKFQEEGWELSTFSDKNDYEGFLQKISMLSDEFMVDLHIPDLLIFPRKTEFHRHPAYQKGSILLQDKASCLPVHILAPPPGSIVLDMCAAPGMKTTHLASMLKDQGTIYAVEQDPRRFKQLENIISNAGTSCVKAINKDVLDCSGKDFPDVEYILVDPSCSGTGMLHRFFSPEEMPPDRLQKLAGFQIKILRSALTRYPKAKKVVYSTCSVLPEENEDVVRQVLETNYNFKLVPAKQFINGAWKNFGSADYGELGACCLYTKPDEDFTNGFFVAVFERLAEGEENKFFNNKIYSYKRGLDKKERKKAIKLERQQRALAESGVLEVIGDSDENSKQKSNEKQSVSENSNGEAEQNNGHEFNSEENVECIQKKNKKKKSKHGSEVQTETISEVCQEHVEEVYKKSKKNKSKKVKDSQEKAENNREKTKKLYSELNKDLDIYLDSKICTSDLQQSENSTEVSLKHVQSVSTKQKKQKRILEDSQNKDTTEETVKKKKKQKKKELSEVEEVFIDLVNIPEENPPKKKKKTKRQLECIDLINSPEKSVSKKKKKKTEIVEDIIDLLDSTEETPKEIPKKRKKSTNLL